MTKEEFFTILDKRVKSQILIMIFLLMLSAGLFALPFILYPDGDFTARSILLIMLASVIFLLCAYSIIFRTAPKERDMMKNVLLNNPKEIVWSYVMNENNSYYLYICLRDGKKVQLREVYIPNKDTNGLIGFLKIINPEMHSGYSMEIEEKFKKKML